MNKIKFFPILVVAALLLSACGKAKTDMGVSTEQGTQVSETSQKKSLEELIALGLSQKCTFVIMNDGQTIKGEVLMSGDRFKQSMEIGGEEAAMKLNSISDGEYFYWWNEGVEGSGTKMKIEKDEEAQSKSTDGTKNFNFKERHDYKCTPVALSEADFAIPSDVEFVDFSEMMRNLQNMNPEELQNLMPQE